MNGFRWRLGVLGSLSLVACSGPLFQGTRPAIERVNPNIPAGRFHVIAAIAGGDSRTDLRMSVTVRQQLEDSGLTVVRRAGRWNSEAEAVHAICATGAAGVDGVLFIWYNRLVLRDCAKEGTAAYEIEGGTSEGITGMANHLIRYLKKRGEADRSPPPN